MEFKPTVHLRQQGRHGLTKVEEEKIGGLAVAGVGVGLLAWFLVHQSLNLDLQMIRERQVWLTIAGTFAVFFLLLGICALVGILVRHRWIARGVLFAIASSYLLWFGVTPYGLLSLGILVLGLWQWERQIKIEQAHERRVAVDRLLNYGLGLTITCFLIVLSLTFYQAQVKKSQVAERPIDSFVHQLMPGLNTLLAGQVSFYDPEMTLDQFLIAMTVQRTKTALQPVAEETGKKKFTIGPLAALEQVSEEDAAEMRKNLPPQLRQQLEEKPEEADAILAQFVADRFTTDLAPARDQVLQQLTLPATGSTTMGDIVEQALAQQGRKFIGKYEPFIPPILALTFYFTLQIFAFLYILLIKMLTGLLFMLLKRTGFVHMAAEEQPVDVVTLQ